MKIAITHKQRKLTLTYDPIYFSLDSVYDTEKDYYLIIQTSQTGRGYEIEMNQNKKSTANDLLAGLPKAEATYVYLPELKIFLPKFLLLQPD